MQFSYGQSHFFHLMNRSKRSNRQTFTPFKVHGALQWLFVEIFLRPTNEMQFSDAQPHFFNLKTLSSAARGGWGEGNLLFPSCSALPTYFLPPPLPRFLAVSLQKEPVQRSGDLTNRSNRQTFMVP